MTARRGAIPRSGAFPALALAGALTLVGCASEDPAEVVSAGGDDLVSRMALVRPSAPQIPGGPVSAKLELLDFDVTVPDAFGRATGQFPFFAGTRYRIDPATRNVTNDPRLPALTGSGTEVVGSGLCRFGHSGFWFSSTDPGFGWDFFCFLDGLKPATAYTVILVRYALTVNGQLDAEEMLLTGTITDPDALTPLGGTPGGYPTEPCDFDDTRPTYTVGVTGDQNPLNMGFVTTDATGSLVFDCLIGSGGFWQGGPQTLTVPDSAPFAPNAISTFDLPRYNYVVVVEGVGTPLDPVPTGPHVMRWQIGSDLAADGSVINNSFAGFPTEALDEQGLSLGLAALSQPDSVTVTLSNLAALTGGAVYQPWFLTAAGPVAATGTYDNISDPDPAVTDVAFSGGAGVHELRLDWPDASAEATHVFLSLEGQAGAGAPSASQPLWLPASFLRGFGEAKTDQQSLVFGTFSGTGEALRPPWSVSGTGEGGLFGSELRVIAEHLPRPPTGYQYAGWLMGTDTALRLPDESFTSPPREFQPLTDADVEAVADVVLPLEILRAAQRFCLTSVPGCPGPIPLLDAEGNMVFDTYVLTLEPKTAGVAPPATQVLVGDLPSP